MIGNYYIHKGAKPFPQGPYLVFPDNDAYIDMQIPIGAQILGNVLGLSYDSSIEVEVPKLKLWDVILWDRKILVCIEKDSHEEYPARCIVFNGKYRGVEQFPKVGDTVRVLANLYSECKVLTKYYSMCVLTYPLDHQQL